MAEPLSNLTPPPDFSDAAAPAGNEERVQPVVAGAHGKLEWVVTDLDIKSLPMTEVFLPGLWRRMHDDGTFGMYFHEGEGMTFWHFVAALSDMTKRYQVVIGHDAEGNAVEHAGIVMLDHILDTPKLKRAVGNFLFFKEYWNRHDSMALGHAVLSHWFDMLKLDLVAGITPRANRAAIRFIKQLGFQIAGDVPGFTLYRGEVSASATSFMTRGMWEKAHPPTTTSASTEEANGQGS